MTRPSSFPPTLTTALALIASAALFGLCQPVLGDGEGCGVLVLVAWVPVLVVTRDAPLRRVLVVATAASTVRHALLLSWVASALTTAGLSRWWAALAVFTLVLFLGSIAGAAVATARVLARRCGLPNTLALPLCVAGAEVAIGAAPFGGFPWGHLGYALATVPLLVQAASVIGVVGLSALAALTNAVVAELLVVRAPGRTRCTIGIAVAVAIGGAWVTFGAWRLRDASVDVTRAGAGARVVVFAPLSSQRAPKAMPSARPYRAQQDAAFKAGAEIVIWPELSLPTVVHHDAPDLTAAGVGANAARPPAAAIIGAPSSDARGALYNSAFVLGANEGVLTRVDKRRLVPFAERTPAPFDVLLAPLFRTPTTPGDDVRAVTVPLAGGGLRIGVLICYEAAFPGLAQALVDDGAEVLVELSNDAWFATIAGKRQHLAQSVLRAVETGAPLVRAANAGVSGLIDVHGRVHDGALQSVALAAHPVTSRASRSCRHLPLPSTSGAVAARARPARGTAAR
ncbi:MAG: apolipoprotein N-acyltransferase [Deltaproteobacteria bacterium]|nr:apolipoprotein N-acyltransferase [Deltaproteobacteria bacterium]